MGLPAPDTRYPWMTTQAQLRKTDMADDRLRMVLLSRDIPILQRDLPRPSGSSDAVLALLLGLSPALLLLRR
jgi:hypothetical protein